MYVCMYVCVYLQELWKQHNIGKYKYIQWTLINKSNNPYTNFLRERYKTHKPQTSETWVNFEVYKNLQSMDPWIDV